jgi:hypothetical protein
MINKLISTGKRKIIVLFAVLFSLFVVNLGLTPNYACGCGGEAQNGTKLTYLINGISKSVIGVKVIKTRPDSENAN